MHCHIKKKDVQKLRQYRWFRYASLMLAGLCYLFDEPLPWELQIHSTTVYRHLQHDGCDGWTPRSAVAQQIRALATPGPSGAVFFTAYVVSEAQFWCTSTDKFCLNLFGVKSQVFRTGHSKTFEQSTFQPVGPSTSCVCRNVLTASMLKPACMRRIAGCQKKARCCKSLGMISQNWQLTNRTYCCILTLTVDMWYESIKIWHCVISKLLYYNIFIYILYLEFVNYDINEQHTLNTLIYVEMLLQLLWT